MSNTEESSMGQELSVTIVDDCRYLGLERELRSGDSTLLLKPVQQAPRLGRISQTLFGMLAPSLAEHLGILTQIINEVLPALTPRCTGCGELAQAPGQISQLAFPFDGFLAAALVDDRQDVPLRDRCELLGSERALIGQHIVRMEDLQDADGEPVLSLLSASHSEEFRTAVSLWLERGSAAVRVLYLAERGSPARELACLRSVWSCARCSMSYQAATKGALLAAEPCARCRGQGWLEVDRGRLFSCEDCDGFGSSSELLRYEWHGTQLRYLAGLPLNSMRCMLPDSSELAATLACAARHGFGDYPLGAPIGTLSIGERARLSALCVELSQIIGVSIGADSAAIFPSGAERSAVGVELFVPACAPAQPAGQQASDQRVIVRAIERGPLSAAELSFPRAALSAIQGESGSGKSLLLEEIAFLFSKRRKLAQQSCFGSLRRCTLVDPFAPFPTLVGDLIGIMPILAEELAGTRVARERGVEARDISLESSRYRCAACAEQAPNSGCLECGGTEIDFMAGDIVFGKMRWSEILHAPLAITAELLWRSVHVSAIAAAIPKSIAGQLTLASRVVSLSGPEQRALQLLSALAKILSARQGARPAPLDGELVLLNAPFSLAMEHQTAVWRMLGELNDRGATILCAGVPQALESSFGSVLWLRPTGQAAAERTRHRMYDVRYARAVRAELRGVNNGHTTL